MASKTWVKLKHHTITHALIRFTKYECCWFAVARHITLKSKARKLNKTWALIAFGVLEKVENFFEEWKNNLSLTLNASSSDELSRRLRVVFCVTLCSGIRRRKKLQIGSWKCLYDDGVDKTVETTTIKVPERTELRSHAVQAQKLPKSDEAVRCKYEAFVISDCYCILRDQV